MQKKVGILGSGVVAKAIGAGFVNTGCEVKLGSRSPTKLYEWSKELGARAHVGNFSEAAAFGSKVIVIATLGEGTESAIDLAGKSNFSGKLVIDATNPLDFSRGMPPGILPAFRDTSLGETIQKKLPDSNVVKCFNAVPNSAMFRPKFPEAEMMICGNDKKAKEDTTSILKEFGWADSIDLGGIKSAKWLEDHTILWVLAASATNDWNSMFRLVR